MARAIDFEINLHLLIMKNSCKTMQTNLELTALPNDMIYIGEIVHMELLCKMSDEFRDKMKTSCSPVSLNAVTNLKRQLSSAVDVRCSVSGVCKKQLQCRRDRTDFNLCNILLSMREDVLQSGLSKSDPLLNTEAFLSEDKTFYKVPLELRIVDIPTYCRKAEICVHVKPSCKLGPSWLSSPTKPESPSIEVPELSSQTAAKIVSQVVSVIHPPELSVQQKHVGNQEIIFLQVKNSESCTLRVEECIVLPESCPKTAAGSQHCSRNYASTHLCIVHANMVKLMSSENLLPLVLQPGECVSLCYTLNLSLCQASFPKDDVVLEAKIKWNIERQCGVDIKHTVPVTTVYRLHSLKLRRGLFVMSATCDNDVVKNGQSFTVTYTIHNRLQDFLSIKLHWSPVLADESVESVRNFERIQRGLICHDPSLQLGSCHYGDTVQAKVSFYATSKGLYEVCKHMKINLRYLIPGSDNNSLASPTSQCSAMSDEHLAVVPDPLWRTRSGSGSSFGTSRPVLDCGKMSTSNKSYSYGDIGPDNSNDDLFKKPSSDKSTVLPRRDPKLNVSPSKYEQMLLSPGNFIKNSCVVKVS